MITWDSLGQIVGGQNRRMRRDDVKFLEARVVDEGICLAIEKKWDNIEIETDAQSVIKQLRNEGYYW